LLRKLLQKREGKFVEAAGEAAFYGPKIDVQMKNVNGKENTAFTVQYDFCMPERFDLNYIGEDGQKHRAFVVHRSSIGAIERIMAFLIEKYAGAFPLWLAPVQARVLSVSEKNADYAKQVYKELKAAGIRVELDDSNESLGKKIREAKTEKVWTTIVVGDKEMEAKTISAENNHTGDKMVAPLSEFITKLETRINNRTND
jgi:threonyl-tRNA synthetase